MTRLTYLLSTFACAGLLAGATIAACGGHPASPGEMPPLAPRPEPVRPNAMPAPGAVSSTSATEASSQPSPVFQAAAEGQPLGDQPTGATLDAGTSDSGAAPLPPLRDGGIPADSRMEPILQRDGGK
jgi:hypothetical protein